MHPWRNAQEVLLCDLCETVPQQNHCELCNINICVNCEGKHLSDSSKRHNVVPFLQRGATHTYLKCPKHAEKHCELHCEECNIPVCSTCVSSGKHKSHDISDILEKLSAETESLQKDLKDPAIRIYPRYQEMASDVQTEKTELETKYGKLTTIADQQREILHRENTYNSEFRTLPPKVRVTVPSFSAQKINKDQLNEMFGSLSSLSINTEHGDTMKSAEAVSSPLVKPLFDEPRLTATINTGYDRFELFSVSCLSDDQVWTCGNNETMKLLNLQSKLLTSIQTKSGNTQRDIAVTPDGNLVYTDYNDRTVNLVKNKQIQTVITLQGWGPLTLCSTASGDLLVTMISDDDTQSKVVRYSGSTETQSIQFDDRGRPLYSSGFYIPKFGGFVLNTKYISENRNLDICVADWSARAVVVVNQSGNLRFRYTGHPSNTELSFDPRGITTDSQSHILTTDTYNDRIHILDQDGQFLRYIHCDFVTPRGLCVDIRDNLFVGESHTAKVKKIRYL